MNFAQTEESAIIIRTHTPPWTTRSILFARRFAIIALNRHEKRLLYFTRFYELMDSWRAFVRSFDASVGNPVASCAQIARGALVGTLPFVLIMLEESCMLFIDLECHYTHHDTCLSCALTSLLSPRSRRPTNSPVSDAYIAQAFRHFF